MLRSGGRDRHIWARTDHACAQAVRPTHICTIATQRLYGRFFLVRRTDEY